MSEAKELTNLPVKVKRALLAMQPDCAHGPCTPHGVTGPTKVHLVSLGLARRWYDGGKGVLHFILTEKGEDARRAILETPDD